MLIRDLLYVFQLENYEIKNFLKFSYTHWRWYNFQKRNTLKWTKKIFLIYFLTLMWFFILFFLAIYNFGLTGLLLSILLIVFLPIIIAFNLLFITPLDLALKCIIIKKAKIVLDRHRNNLIIIGISGSYGKTSTREILYTILSKKFKVLKFDGNVNTDIGIAEAIIANRDKLNNVDILIIEMGAYRLGDIKKICKYIKSDYSILTGINESHLEKFGTINNTIKTKFELSECTKKTSVLNFNNKIVKNHYGDFNINNTIGVESNKVMMRVLDNFDGLEFEVDNVLFKTKLLARHNVDLILLCVEIAKLLKMTIIEIADAVEKIDYIKHRLELIYNNVSDVYVIDDSYNGNLDGFRSGLEVLTRAKGRKVVLTPGLVELGDKNEEIHSIIGALYADNGVDLVLLIESKSAESIIRGMMMRGFNNYRVYKTTAEAHADLLNILRAGDAILFQNDWSDNYF